ncbi:uncharacterized protein LOC105836832 [Monomorium pharaonis]|uniref:uncharacterized protein LOC105836832 n=1 Tax=Monomorium pharaonis TaxID=307658 RepID=UPI00063EDE25|nr:uncharacterized protein LOC105836832 [Monomorium pharaonis]
MRDGEVSSRIYAALITEKIISHQTAKEILSLFQDIRKDPYVLSSMTRDVQEGEAKKTTRGWTVDRHYRYYRQSRSTGTALEVNFYTNEQGADTYFESYGLPWTSDFFDEILLHMDRIGYHICKKCTLKLTHNTATYFFIFHVYSFNFLICLSDYKHNDQLIVLIVNYFVKFCQWIINYFQ